MKNLIIKYPVATYYILTFLISWGGLILLIGGPGRINSQQTNAPFLNLYLITVAGPIISGVLLTGLYYGKKGYRDFLSRLFKWRVPVKWYAIALVIAPLTVFAALFALSLFSHVFMPGIFESGNNPIASSFGLPEGNKITLVLFVFMLSLFNGFVEELGWTGFATPILLRNQNLFKSGITLGIMWGLWHLFSNYLGSADAAGSISLLVYLPVMLFSFLPPFRILMIWVYRHTGSLWLAVLMHASLDMFWMLSMPLSLTGKERIIWYTLWAVVLWIIVIIIGIVDNKKKVD
ncbi:CPBP family intramembrane metalloprotease [Chryseotalea sanaruensis]|uniref:CPBP family intramembrane metalloprotease n=1 Tax=Chryseotalea sanaruensis TaxID=2482724 RepID=A0A401UE73_9BACT|nr:CPBP family intramembrane glutamic endopeptidase [Chryseotalea sanaruensis]GCC53170.1 CPBP family intramembrane metalloprotease [Chryseotalea sanaruensis]